MKRFFYFLLFCLMFFSGENYFSQIKKQGDKQMHFSTKGSSQKAGPDGFVRCSTTEYEEYLQAKYPERLNTEQFEAWLAPLIEKQLANKSEVGNVITIPVVVHVIHSGQPVGTAPNITDAQVQSQITVLNNDYRRLSGTPGYNTNSVGADVEIQFALAKVDPNGNPTNGIDRVNMCQYNWSVGDIETKVKPNTIWDPTQYMNMWSIRFADATLLGYAQFPSNSTLAGIPNAGLDSTDGVVSGFAFFGSSDYNDGTFLLAQGYDKGRTMTHEVGHFLGLRHIWGDNSSCIVDITDSTKDYCPDTPAANAPNYNCVAKDSCPTAPGSDMIENYMDYSPDSCMNIFTLNQKTRMRTVMNNALRRFNLKSSTKDQPIPLFANDAEIKIDGTCAIAPGCGANNLKFLLYNRGTSNLTSASFTYSVNGGAVQTYNWTGNLAQDKFATIAVPISSTPTSPVTATIISANGVADQRVSNNTANGTYQQPTLPTYYNTTTVNFELQRDKLGTETMWNLRNSAGQIVKSGGPYQDTATPPALFTETWNLPQDCYVFMISDAQKDGFEIQTPVAYVKLSTSSGSQIYYATENFGGYGTVSFTNRVLATTEVKNDNEISVYPNPVSDVLHITKVSDKAVYKIYSVAGQLVMFGTIKNSQVNVSELVKGDYLISINDKEKSANIKFIKK